LVKKQHFKPEALNAILEIEKRLKDGNHFIAYS